MAYNALPPWDVASRWVHRPVARWNPSSQKAPLGMLRWPRQHQQKQKHIWKNHQSPYNNSPNISIAFCWTYWPPLKTPCVSIPTIAFWSIYKLRVCPACDDVGHRSTSRLRDPLYGGEWKKMDETTYTPSKTNGWNPPNWWFYRCFPKAPRGYFVGSMGSFKV